MSSEDKTISIAAIGAMICDTKLPMKQRFRALFTLRNLGGEKAIKEISKVFTDSSALLKHECAYCLGQMQDVKAIPILSAILEDKMQEPIVRHEAGEALGAIGDPSAIPVIKKYCSDNTQEVAETCQLALGRIEWLQSQNPADNDEVLPANPYASVDPTPPSKLTDIVTLKQRLLNEELSLFERYRAMFTLRNMGGEPAAVALAEGLQCTGALFRHEIAYVLGQMADPATVPYLTKNLQNPAESSMVRHECAEALGSIATDECMDILERYRSDSERVVKESCEVALDMCEYHTTDQFQYADGLSKLAT